MKSDRLADLKSFYRILNSLEKSIRGQYLLEDLDGIPNFPKKGVYFFFEPDEHRSETGFGDRVVRVGTHGLRIGSKSTLKSRLAQHRGFIRGKHPGSGNHRGSIFRKHIGFALINKNLYPRTNSKYWGVGSNATSIIKNLEVPIEIDVSKYINTMPFIWIEIDDLPSPNSLRDYIERNSIALLSNFGKSKFDHPNTNWLGFYTSNPAITESGLWNVNHVGDVYDVKFLDILQNLIFK